MMEGRAYYAAHSLCTFVAAFIDRFLRFLDRCRLTRMSFLHTHTMFKMLLGQVHGAWVEGEVARLRSENRKLKKVIENKFALQCSSRLFTLKSHLPDHLVENAGRLRSLSFMDAWPFEHFRVLIKKSYGTLSRRLLTKMHETVENTNSALDSGRPESKVREHFLKSSVLRKRECMEGGAGYFLRDGIEMFPG